MRKTRILLTPVYSQHRTDCILCHKQQLTPVKLSQDYRIFSCGSKLLVQSHSTSRYSLTAHQVCFPYLQAYDLKRNKLALLLCPFPPSFPSSPSRWLLHLHPPWSCQSLSLCSHHGTVTGIWFYLFCLWAVTVSPVSLVAPELLHINQSSAPLLCSSCVWASERGVGGSSKSANIWWEQQWNISAVLQRAQWLWFHPYFHLLDLRCVFVLASFHCTASPF